MNEQCEERVDEDLRRAVDSVRSCVDRVSETSSGQSPLLQRDVCNAILSELMQSADAEFGCIICPASPNAQSDQSCLRLIASARQTPGRGVEVLSGTLINRRPDDVVQTVLTSKVVRVHSDIDDEEPAPGCLPEECPKLSNYVLLPYRYSVSATGFVFLANSHKALDRRLVHRMQIMIAAVVRPRSHSNSLPESYLSTVQKHNSARQFAKLMNASLHAIVIANEGGRVTGFNPAAERMFGVAARHALGSPVSSYIASHSLTRLLKESNLSTHPAGLLDRQPQASAGLLGNRSDGSTFSISVVSYQTFAGSQMFTTFMVDDISTEQKSSHESEQVLMQFRALTNLAPVGILQLSKDWTCTYANDTYCDLAQLDMAETLGAGWIDAIHADDVESTLVELREAISDGHGFEREIRLQPSIGSIVWVTINATATFNEKQQLTGCLVTMLDITEKNMVQQRLHKLAHHDSLTGLANRTSFHELLDRVMSHRDGSEALAVLFIDLDGFKAVNDTHGHDAGDELLVQVSDRLRESVRGDDALARLGGDEFTVTLHDGVSLEIAQVVADQIVKRMNASFKILGKEVFISASVGIAICGNESISRDELIRRADSALYLAKSAGRAQWVVYSDDIQREKGNHSELLAKIRRAVESSEFELHYQPQVGIHDDSVVGFEALLRWPDRPDDINGTEEIIALLEETGLICEVGQWALAEACRQYVAWQMDGLLASDASMSVNVVARQLSRPEFKDELLHILQITNMNPNRLILEITESAFVEDTTSSRDILSAIRAMGVRIALDDFGTGYSSLAYLIHMSIDQLKIDKSFIAAIDSCPEAVSIVRTIVALARPLNIDVIAEGVEEADTLPKLIDEGCESFQGYLYSPPLPPRDIGYLLVKNQTCLWEPSGNFIDVGELLPAGRFQRERQPLSA